MVENKEAFGKSLEQLVSHMMGEILLPIALFTHNEPGGLSENKKTTFDDTEPLSNASNPNVVIQNAANAGALESIILRGEKSIFYNFLLDSLISLGDRVGLGSPASLPPKTYYLAYLWTGVRYCRELLESGPSAIAADFQNVVKIQRRMWELCADAAIYRQNAVVEAVRPAVEHKRNLQSGNREGKKKVANNNWAAIISILEEKALLGKLNQKDDFGTEYTVNQIAEAIAKPAGLTTTTTNEHFRRRLGKKENRKKRYLLREFLNICNKC